MTDRKINSTDKAPYTRPELAVYGQFSRMTAGGSGAELEAAMGDMGAMRRA